MRWGVPGNASDCHGTTELCLNEINNCKMYSIGPNFVVIKLINKLKILRKLKNFFNLRRY